MSERIKVIKTRVGYNPSNLKKVNNEKYVPYLEIKWSKKGKSILIHDNIDFIFSSTSYNEAINQLNLLLELNEGFEITFLKITHE